MIYLDHAATTPLHPEVLSAMFPYLTECYGNPNSLHRAGKAASRAIETAREQLSTALCCAPDQLVFTSGGSMANNLAVFSAVRYLSETLHRTPRCFTAAIEHSSMLSPMRLQQNLRIGKVDAHGFLTELPDDSIDFAAIQFANNELGSIQDMEKLSAHCKQHHILLHTDAVQAFGQTKIDLKSLPVDFLSLSAHKFSGPKGIGALFVRDKRMVSPLIHGNNRVSPIAGTENVAGIVGMAKAAELAMSKMQENVRHKQRLRELLKELLLAQIPDIRILTPEENALPGILSVCFTGIESEALLYLFDLSEICLSAGAACHAGEKTPSHVLSAIGLPENDLQSVIRFSIGNENTEDEIRKAAISTANWVEKLRKLKN